MLITRTCPSESSPWQLHKYKSSLRRPGSPRMSDKYDLPVRLQPSWHDQYACLSRHESDGSLPKPHADSRRSSEEPRPSQPMVDDVQARVKREQEFQEHLRCTSDALAPGSARHHSPGQEPTTSPDKTGCLGQAGPYNGSGCFLRSSGPNHLRTLLSIKAEGASEKRQARHEEDGPDAPPGEEQEMEGDDEAAAGEGDALSRSQTVEERLATRKMKRFRYCAAADASTQESCC